MENIVSFKRWYYPIIARVIMDREIYYRTAIIECAQEVPSFGYNELEEVIFEVQNEEAWATSSVKNWSDALAEVRQKTQGFAEKVEENGFFVTIRPLTQEVQIARQMMPPKQAVASRA